MAEPQEIKDKFQAWTNEAFSQSALDPKTAHFLAMVAALALGNDGAASDRYFSPKKAGASESELGAAANIAAAVTGMNRYTLLPKE